MSRPLFKWMAISLCLVSVVLVMNFEIQFLLQPKIIGVLFIGTFVLAISRKLTTPSTSWLESVRFNALFVGFLMTLVYLLAYATSPNIGFENTLTPLIYGSLLYLILGYDQFSTVSRSVNVVKEKDPFEVATVSSILTSKGFSAREIHVALKMMQQLPNKEIAKDLFISEATVKKHVQNMFKKCEAHDRAHFTQLYLKWYEER